AVDCAAVDDLSQPLGSAQEGMLVEALHVLSTGNCSAVAGAADAAQKAFYATHSQRRRQVPEFGQLINAY
ncbi:MAG: hypothetical protein HKN70_07640, partial [Gammaproteobacteria bacterium]|nr:hypothetical protein [Gammaproteobacteria bacterium]